MSTQSAQTISLAEYAWVPPAYNISQSPRCIHTSLPVPGDDISQTSPADFVRSAKWCPDGSSALAQCESGCLQFLDLPQELLTASLQSEIDPPVKHMSPLNQPSPIVDFSWYPTATCRDPASFCFVTSVRECPVKLLDASDGRLRASYKIVDHRERHIAPHSLAFNPTASKLYCGFEDAIEVFDVHCPGEGSRLHTTPSKKSRDGLKGIISTLAFASDMSSGVYAAGTLNPSPTNSSNVALFSETTGGTPVMFVGDESDGGFGIRASVMQVMFNPSRPYLLYASFRRHDTIYCWDVRGDAGAPVQKLTTESEIPDTKSGVRQNSTNQKLRFDIDLSGKCLSVGDHSGYVSLFDVDTYKCAEKTPVLSRPVSQYRAHEDAVGSVGFHPLHPLLLSVSGSRHFPGSFSDGGGLEDSDGEDEDEEGIDHHIARPRERPLPHAIDNSVKLWQF